jgi:hypothetical protein
LISLFYSSVTHLSRVLATFPETALVQSTDVWSHFAHGLPRSSCAVVVLPWLEDELFPLLCELKLGHPSRPLVLVTSKDADNARHLRALPAEEVVWIRDVERDLWAAVRRATTRHALSDIALEVERMAHVPSTLRKALGIACRRDVPVRSVAELAAAVHCRRSTLWYHWRRAMGGAGAARLEDFLGWVLLVRAVGRKSPRQPWPTVATALGVHERTLARLARRLTGSTLEELSIRGERGVIDLFRDQVLQRLEDNMRRSARILDSSSLPFGPLELNTAEMSEV